MIDTVSEIVINIKAKNTATASINQLAKSLNSLQTQIQSTSNASSKLNGLLNKMDNSSKKVNNNMNGFAKSIAKSVLSFATLRKAARLLAGTVTESSAWVENLNLFAISFGNASEDALDFAFNLSKAYNVSSNEIIRFTGLFKQMSEAIGMAESTSNSLSLSISSLGYDIASFYNISTETAMEKLRAGLAGQTKPLHELGLDITEQSLDNYLKNMGADFTSKTLDQSQKMLLRGIVILSQSRNAYGDLAKTIGSVNNQIKVMNGSLQNLKLALGDAIKKPIENILPYINAFIIAVTNIIRAFVPLNKTTGFKNITDEIVSGADDATESVEDLNSTLGLFNFDKFNVASKGTGTVIGGNDATTNFLTDAFNKQNQEYMDALNKQLENIENKAQAIAEKISSWFINADKDGGFIKWTNQAKTLFTTIISITTLWTGITIFNKLAKSVENSANSFSLLQKILSPTGLVIAGIVALVAYGYATNEAFRNSVNDLISVSMELLSAALTPIAQILQGIFTAATPIINIIVKLTSILMPGLTKMLKEFIPIIQIIGNILLFISGLVESIIEVITTLLSFDYSKLTSLPDRLAKIWDKDFVMPDIFKFASGGLPEKGSLFVANEAGPELVANIGGGQTGVMNMRQFEEAAYKGFSRALQSYGMDNQNMTIRFDIDNSTLARALMPELVSENRRQGNPLTR